jgi:plastocyanin
MWRKIAWYSLVTLALLLGWPVANADAQVVQNCQPNQYVDRTAPGASREITWDLSVVNAPERCMKVRVGQTVLWNGDLGMHPLGGQGGDDPSLITFHDNGSVTFTKVGTFGFHCLVHSVMIGAIMVVAAPTPSVPALSPWLVATLTVLLVATGGILVRNHRSRRSASAS